MRWPPSWTSSDHWSAASSSAQRVLGREDARELGAEAALVGEAGEERAEAAAQQPLADVGLARCSSMLPLKSSAPLISMSSSPRRSRAISSVATEVPMSWPATKTRLRAGASHQLSAGVGLPGERVGVVARLLGEAEAEEVEAQARLAGGAQPEQRPPVIRAGGEAVQEEQQHAIATVAPPHEQLATEHLLDRPLVPPAPHPVRQHGLKLVRLRPVRSPAARRRPCGAGRAPATRRRRSRSGRSRPGSSRHRGRGRGSRPG